jgi:hypothetical protein
MSLPEVLAPDVPEGRSEKYVVYSVLDSMVATAFDALNEVDLMREDLAMKSTEMRGGRVQMATLREMISGLGRIRRRAGPQRGLCAARRDYCRLIARLARVKDLDL